MINQSFIIPVIKITDSCNYNCKFCYYAQNQLSSDLMDIELCKKIVKEVYDYNVRQSNENMRIIFHGGEPLLQPIEFFETMLEYEKELNKSNAIRIYHSVQSNGYYLDDNWIRFFKQNNFDVGISIDGPSWLNFHYNKRGADYCTNRVINNIQKLVNIGVSFGIISVITNEHLDYPEVIYDFCKDNNISDLSLNYCYNPESDDSVDTEKLKGFLSKLFDLYYEGEYPLNIREFNEIIAKISGYCSDTCATCNRENCGQYMTFDSAGNVFFCDTAYDKSTAIGNIRTESLFSIINSTQYLKTLIHARESQETRCVYCKYNYICGSGCYRYDTNSKNYFCETQKYICEYILGKVKDDIING